MECLQVREMLQRLLDKELPEAQAEAVHLHLQGCPFCLQEWRELELTRHLLQEAPIPEPPPAFWERVRSHWLQELRRLLPSPVATLRFALLFGTLVALFLLWWRSWGVALWTRWLPP